MRARFALAATIVAAAVLGGELIASNRDHVSRRADDLRTRREEAARRRSAARRHFEWVDLKPVNDTGRGTWSSPRDDRPVRLPRRRSRG